MKRIVGWTVVGMIWLAAGCTVGALSPPVLAAADLAPSELGNTPEPNWAAAGTYLGSLFDAPQQLLREYPGATTFWVSPDNALAARALAYLPTPDVSHSAALLSRLQTLAACGCTDEPEHDGLLNHHIDPVIHKGALVPLQPRAACVRTPRMIPQAKSSCSAPGAQCPPRGVDLRHEDHPERGWSADSCQTDACTAAPVAGWDEEGLGMGAADLLALQILNRKNRGLLTQALWENLVSKWDGQGLRDRAAMTDGRYATYKLALLKICARALGQALPDGVDRKLVEAQNAQGGFRSQYDLSGQFTLDQLGNTLTTAYVILAYRKPLTDF
jgi:hypothetical protein